MHLFGPYLGGLRVRQAVSGLHRILPLRFTGTGATGGERDFARLRGVTSADFDWILDAVVAVLRRHPDAVARAHAALDDLRTRAADALSFELAGRIQAESEAIEWITGPQRVTLATDEAFDVHGWADGVLVSFRVRGGRLSEWTSRPTDAEAGQRLLATTPAGLGRLRGPQRPPGRGPRCPDPARDGARPAS